MERSVQKGKDWSSSSKMRQMKFHYGKIKCIMHLNEVFLCREKLTCQRKWLANFSVSSLQLLLWTKLILGPTVCVKRQEKNYFLALFPPAPKRSNLYLEENPFPRSNPFAVTRPGTRFSALSHASLDGLHSSSPQTQMLPRSSFFILQSPHLLHTF